jgi:CRP-like cAMP-binding protein
MSAMQMSSQITSIFKGSRKYLPQTNVLWHGETANEIFLVKSGCLRAWFNKDGKDITLQFFFEGDMATSLENFLHNIPSNIFLEAIEETEVGVIDRESFFTLLTENETIKEWFYEEAIRKLFTHTNRLLSLLQYKPFERYQQLLAGDTRIVRRVPQQYIASYLGVTPVSLSRIRYRKK